MTNKQKLYSIALVSAAMILMLASIAEAAPLPTISSISPTTGSYAGGTVITITGTNFEQGSAVFYGSGHHTNQATDVVVNSSTQITATTPAGTGTVDFHVATPSGGQSATSTADQFTYTASSPIISSISPTTGSYAGGTVITITGMDFEPESTVAFGLNPATGVIVNSLTSITATSPAGIGTVDVTITNLDGQSATSTADQFTYTATAPLPTISSISPTTGSYAGGTVITITGTNFEQGSAVFYGSGHHTNQATDVVVNSSTQITATDTCRNWNCGLPCRYSKRWSERYFNSRSIYIYWHHLLQSPGINPLT